MSGVRAAELFPAGEILADELEARGWTQTEFASIIDRPVQFVSEVITGKKEITRESAAQFEAALGVSAQFWLSTQDEYLLWKQEQDPRTQDQLGKVHLRAQLREIVPLAEFRKRGYVQGTEPEAQVKEICDLFGVSSLQDVTRLRFAARRNNEGDAVTPTQNAWVGCVRAAARGVNVEPYSAAMLREIYPTLPGLTLTPDGLATLQGILAQSGVKIVFVEAFHGGRIDGCAFLEDDTPVIGISGRGKRLDKVFFTIMHELAHVLLEHLTGSEVLLDEVDDAREGMEKEADDLAQHAMWDSGLEPPGKVTGAWVTAQAKAHEVHPILVVGRLQNTGALSWKSTLTRGAPTAINAMRKWQSGLASTA